MALNGQLVVNLLTTKPNWDAPPSTSGQISGGHFNPAVTLAVVLSGRPLEATTGWMLDPMKEALKGFI